MNKPLLLATIDERCPDLEMPDGRLVPIREIDGIGMQLLLAMNTQEHPDVTYWHIAERVLPDLSHDEVFGMTLSQVVRIVSIACGTAVKALDALGGAPAPESAGIPTPASETPSVT